MKNVSCLTELKLLSADKRIHRGDAHLPWRAAPGEERRVRGEERERRKKNGLEMLDPLVVSLSFLYLFSSFYYFFLRDLFAIESILL